MWNDGKGEFSPGPSTTLSGAYEEAALFFVARGPPNVALADLDGDGLVEAAAVSSSVPSLTVLRNGTGATSRDDNGDGIPDDCLGASFHRGDPNGSGALDISDAVFLLRWLFLGGKGPACDDAADSNDDGGISITDPIVILGFLFHGTAAPADPFRTCGRDSTPEELACGSFLSCE
jgi:hypothetical protein